MPQQSNVLKIVFIQTGKTNSKEIESLESEYYKRIKRYVQFERVVVPDLKNAKNLKPLEVNRQEAVLLKRYFEPNDLIILLDDKGKQYKSVEFANHLQKLMNRSPKRIVFVIGGPYGFDSEMYGLATEKLSLSKMTFSHQIIRAIFAEQLYRGISILNNDPYHHE